jgi:hypothetical protein
MVKKTRENIIKLADEMTNCIDLFDLLDQRNKEIIEDLEQADKKTFNEIYNDYFDKED